MSYVYMLDQELPAMTFNWQDKDAATIDFSSGYTFTAKLCLTSAPTAILLTKSSGITGAATSPNITVAWTAADFVGLAAGTYRVLVYARRTADSLDRVFSPGAPPVLTLQTAPA